MLVRVRRLVSGVVMWLCLWAGLGLVSGAPALAAAPEQPTVEVTGRKASEVSLRGVLYPNATGEPGSYEFLYKQSATECEGESKTSAGIATGNPFEEVFETLSGLQAGKRYTVCLSVTSPEGTTLSPPVTFTAPIAPETPEGLQAETINATTATLHGVLNPLAQRTAEPGSYEFLYKKSASECEGEFATPSTAAAGAQTEAVSAPVTELLPHTQYTFCLRAYNEAGEAALSAPSTFTTLAAAPVIEETSVSGVSSTSATLLATINPRGAATTYVFEYAPAGGSFAPLAEGEGKGTLPEGVAGVPVGVHVQLGLAAHTAYRFRVAATNSVEKVLGEPVSFTTQQPQTSSALPDGRQWELVSPPVKEGGDIVPLGEEVFVQAAAGGDAIVYMSFLAPTEPNPAGFTQESQVFSWRGAGGGWSSRDINAPHEEAIGPSIGGGGEYKLFSSDLSLGLIEPFGAGDPPLSANASERTPYIRADAPLAPQGAAEQAVYAEARAQAPAGSNVGYLPLVWPGDVPPGTVFGGRVPLTLGGSEGVKFEGASPDMTHVALRTEAALTETAAEAGVSKGLYEWSDGQLQLVSVLPGAGQEAVHGQLGSGESARNAISADGSRVVWNDSGHLYLRDTVKHETVQLDVPEPECLAKGQCEPAEFEETKAYVYFQFASSDDSKVFFTDGRRLTSDAGADVRGNGNILEPDLYECEIVETAGKLACDLSDLTPSHAGERAFVRGTHGAVVGTSEDGSYVYLVAEGVLAPGATPGHNLYVLHESGGAWTTGLVAKLSEADWGDWAGKDPAEAQLLQLSARVSPDGGYLAFMSQRSLTGYDNRDATSGQPDEEVYLYHAEVSPAGQLEQGRLICASCNPTGARPVGVEIIDGKELAISGGHGAWPSGVWLAANIPGWVAEREIIEGRYQPRYLSDSGRLFFNGVDPLVPQAANGVADVYEYEPAGTGDCSSSNSRFAAVSGGCVALVSGASSGEESVFLDASEDGSDVFFLTSARLTGQDVDTAIDVYDAHLCSALAPCAPAIAAVPACMTADACRAALAPQPAIFGAPSSSTFSGAGNVAPAAPVVKPRVRSKPVKCRRGRVRKKGRCVRRGRAGRAKGSARRSASGKAGR